MPYIAQRSVVAMTSNTISTAETWLGWLLLCLFFPFVVPLDSLWLFWSAQLFCMDARRQANIDTVFGYLTLEQPHFLMPQSRLRAELPYNFLFSVLYFACFPVAVNLECTCLNNSGFGFFVCFGSFLKPFTKSGIVRLFPWHKLCHDTVSDSRQSSGAPAMGKSSSWGWVSSRMRAEAPLIASCGLWFSSVQTHLLAHDFTWIISFGHNRTLILLRGPYSTTTYKGKLRSYYSRA